MCLSFFAGSPLPHPHYPQSAVEMLHLPRRLVLILSWNETVWGAHITYSTFHDAMKPLCPYYSDPNTGPISKSQAPWDHKQNLLWTDVSSSKHGANYIVDTSARNMAYLWSLWIPECSTKDIRYCGQVPPKLQWICQYSHDQTAFFIIQSWTLKFLLKILSKWVSFQVYEKFIFPFMLWKIHLKMICTQGK